MVLAFIMPTFFEWFGELCFQFFTLLDSLWFEGFTIANILLGCAFSYAVVKIFRSIGGI